MIKIIVAYSENRVIGKDGSLPWRIPEDMNHFKITTGTDPVVMGRVTYDSLPIKFKPLPNRLNLVVSRSPRQSESTEVYVNSIENAITKCNDIYPNRDIWIIGGSQIYKESLPFVDEIWASEIKGNFDGDTFFPKTGEEWKKELISSFSQFDVFKYSKINA